MQQELEALKIALLQDDDKAGQMAAANVLSATLLLFERGVIALETLASVVEPHGGYGPVARTTEL